MARCRAQTRQPLRVGWWRQHRRDEAPVACGPRPGWGPLQQGTLACAASGGRWSQDRLCRAGLSEASMCGACKLDRGTIKHRVYLCPLLEPWRRQALSEEVLAMAKAAEDDHPLWCRGLLPRGMLPLVPAFAPRRQVVWTRRGDGTQTIEGDVFTDGSVTNPDIVELSAGGWAVAQLTHADGSNPQCVVLFHGQVPYEEVDSTICEIYALYMALCHVAGFMRIHIDNDETINGVRQGER